MSPVGREERVKSTCSLCNRLCGVLVHLCEGRVTKVEGDPDSPVNRGSLCVKGPAAVELLYHPARLKYPLRRAGARGEGKWQRISWDEALDRVAEALNRARERDGAESVVFVQGSPKGFGPYLQRLGNLFGTPNMTSPAHVCSIPRSMGTFITYGVSAPTDTTADLDYPPACVLLWGANVAYTHQPNYIRLERALAQGTKLIVIDPRRTGLASRADLWLQPRPGTDLALALAMLNVIINEGLYDQSFVDNWTVGFERLVEHVQSYSPQGVAEISWVPAQQIAEAARLYAITKPACIRDGNAFEQNINSVQTGRALSILRAITGNLGLPGGDVAWEPLPLGTGAEFTLRDRLPEGQLKKRIGADGDFLPLPLGRIALPQLVVKAILEEKPYPVRVLSVHGSNPLLTWSNAQETYRALMKLDFLAVADLTMTPTAELADVVLPVTSYLEVNDVAARPPFLQVRQKVAQVGECWSDQKIVNELAKKLGLAEYFWDDVEQALDVILQPAGITFAELRKIGAIKVGREYRKYERDGFNTPSGKVEIYSSMLELLGHEPLPVYHEPPETSYSAPELAGDYPLILTSWHNIAFHHSDHRYLASMRRVEPEPVVELHPETAKGLGIESGDLVYIETKRGRIKQRAVLNDGIDPRVVGVSYGWWFPEQGVETLHGWQESNINLLTASEPPYNPQIGSTNLRGFLCRVYKAPDADERRA